MGQGLPPLTGEAQGVLVLGAMGQRGGQAGGATGHASAPGGRQPSLGSRCPQHLGWGRTAMFVSFPAPESTLCKAQTPTRPGDQAPGTSHSLCRRWGSSHRGRGQATGVGLAESSTGCGRHSSHCRETRGSTPPEDHSLGQGRGSGVSGQSLQGARCELAKGSPFLGRTQPWGQDSPSR